MAATLLSKIVASLPGVLTADTVYFVRVGTGFDTYVTNHSGTIVAYPENKAVPLDQDGYPFPPSSANVNVNVAAGATATALGPGTATTGTLTAGAILNVGLRYTLVRQQCVTASTAGNTAGPRSNALNRWRGNAAGLGGFDVMIRFGSTLLTGHQILIGLSTLDITADPSTLGHSVCLAADAGDTNFQWLTRDGTNFNKVDTGVAKTSTDLFRVRLVAAANASTVTALLFNETTSTLVRTDTLSTNLPGNTTFMAVMARCRNGATTTAAQVDFLRWVSWAGSS
jgi:hypothetical protein